MKKVKLGDIGWLFLVIIGLLLIGMAFFPTINGKIVKGTDKPSKTIVTPPADPGAIIWVEVTSDSPVEVRVVKYDNRESYVTYNGSYEETLVVAEGKGTHVSLDSLSSLNIAPVRTSYGIIVIVPPDANYTEQDISYTVKYTIWTPNYVFMFLGVVMLTQAFIFLRLKKMAVPSVALRVEEERGPAAAPQRPPMRERVPAAAAAPPAPGREAPPAPRREAPPAPVREEVPPEPPVVEEKPPEPMREERKPLKKIRCSNCKTIIPIYTDKRPIKVTCPNCGRSGVLRK